MARTLMQWFWWAKFGGQHEAEAEAYIRDHMSKPVAAYIAGLSAPKGRRVGCVLLGIL